MASAMMHEANEIAEATHRRGVAPTDNDRQGRGIVDFH